jgi:hypothetical protein
MTREEFWEWLATCPTHKYESTTHIENESDFGYITVVFKVQEEENLREKNLRDGLLKHLAMKIEEDKNESISQ